MMDYWLTANSSCTGLAHKKTNLECQDASYACLSESGNWAVLVVCDGAGSAKYAAQGSSHVGEHFARQLIKLARDVEEREPGTWIIDAVIECVLSSRKTLRVIAGTDSLNDFHTTLVACMVGPSGGFSIHIGDGHIAYGYRDASKNSLIGYSKPQNGEYSNETFFVTEKNWIKNLRISPLPPVDWIVCTTDGGSSLSFVDDHNIKPGFVWPLFESLASIPEKLKRDQAIKKALENPLADKITGDDKTLSIAIRNNQDFSFDSYFDATVSKPAIFVPESSSETAIVSVDGHKSLKKQVSTNENIPNVSKYKTFLGRAFKRESYRYLRVAVLKTLKYSIVSILLFSVFVLAFLIYSSFKAN